MDVYCFGLHNNNVKGRCTDTNRTSSWKGRYDLAGHFFAQIF